MPSFKLQAIFFGKHLHVVKLSETALPDLEITYTIS